MSTDTQAFKQRDLRIPADLSMLHDAREWACQAALDFGLDGDDAFMVKLAASEAVTNAIVHGSGPDGDTVTLDAHEECGALVFEVHDSGGSLEAVEPAARVAEGGRGLELVETVMDEVELTRRDKGSILRFAKRRSEAA